MSEAKMPATEAETGVDEQAFANYELSYHVLPTVADGEVNDVRDRVAAMITNVGGEISIEEAPERIDLVYDIDKYLEGKHRTFSSAYFGWIRFRVERAVIERLTAEIENDKALLRYLLIRLTKEEEAMPFYFHAARAEEKKVTNVDADIDPNAATKEAVDTSDVDDTVTTATDASSTTTDESVVEAPEAEQTAETKTT